MTMLITVLLCVVRCTDVTVTSKAMFYLLECICNGQNLDIRTHNHLVGHLKMKKGGWVVNCWGGRDTVPVLHGALQRAVPLDSAS